MQFVVLAMLLYWGALGIRLTILQRAYLRHYRQVRNIRVPLSEDLNSLGEGLGAFGLAMDAYWEPQSAPILEQARQRVVTTFIVGAVSLVGFLFAGCVAMLLSWPAA
jgi:hypothetical protein